MMKKFRNPRTKELLKIMRDHELTQAAVSRLVGCARNTVHYWLKEKPVIPGNRLRLLKLEIALQSK